VPLRKLKRPPDVGKKTFSLLDITNPEALAHLTEPRIVYLSTEPPRTDPKHLEQQKRSYSKHVEKRRKAARDRYRDQHDDDD